MRGWLRPLVILGIFLTPQSAFFVVPRSPPRCFILTSSGGAGDGHGEARTVLREELGLRSDAEAAALVEGYPGMAALEDAELRARLAVLAGGFRGGGTSSPAGKRAARSLVARHPAVLRHGAEESAARLAALKALLPGLRSGELMQLLQRQPTLLGLDADAVLAPNVAALRRLLCLREDGGGGGGREGGAIVAAGRAGRKDQAVLERVVRHAPSLLAYDSEVLAAKLGAIAELLNVTAARAAGVVSSKAPTLLTLSVDDNLRPSFRALAALLLPPAAEPSSSSATDATTPLYLTPGYAATAKVLQRAPSLLAYSNATIKRKVQQLENVLFASATAASVSSSSSSSSPFSSYASSSPSSPDSGGASGSGSGSGGGAPVPAPAPATSAASAGEGADAPADERRAAVAKLVALAPNVLTLDMEGNLLPKVRELQVLFARRQPSEEAAVQARGVRQAAALRLLARPDAPARKRPFPGTRGASARAGKGKASSLLRASLSLRIAERTALGGSGGRGATAETAAAAAAAAAEDVGSEANSDADGGESSGGGDRASGGVGGSGVDERGGLLAPLLPRAEVVRLVARAPTLLQRNVATSLAPKLELLRRHVGQYGGGGGGGDDGSNSRSSSSSSSSIAGDDDAQISPLLASGADELVRCYPRLLLSSYGVLGRVVFLAQKQRSERRAARARLLRDLGGGEDDDDDDDNLRCIREDGGKNGAGLSGDAAKAAIMAPAAKFRAAHGDEYARYLRSALLAHHRSGASAADGVDPPSAAPSTNNDGGGGGGGGGGEARRTVIKAADGESALLAAAAKKRRDQIEALLEKLDTCPVDKLEKEHGEALKEELLSSPGAAFGL